MKTMESILSRLKPARVLDLATGSGSFALRLASGLGSYGEILATDSQAKALAGATKNLAQTPRARVEEADAEALPYQDGGFDLVSVAFSLHHFRDPAKVLREALRVLSPGGHLVIFEMHNEAGNPESLTHVLLHHWWAAIDRLAGTHHLETFDRASIRALLDGLGLKDIEEVEVLDEEGDPLAPELVEEISDIITTYLGRIPASSADANALKARGEELLDRAKKIGFRSAPALFIVGTKA